ncbi:MAG: TonB-dependent receptor [Candidatus Gastranaerophilales bacterium]|nr:TonB-dependent receptor [Candidatus Gastranaerophilales bacterium]
MKKLFYLLAVVLLLYSNSANAITEEVDFDYDPKTNTFFAQTKKTKIFSLDNFAEDARTSGASIDVIKRDDIKKMNTPSFADVLNSLGSVTVQNSNGSDGNLSSVRIRGTDRVRMTLDGIRIDRPSMTSPGVETQFLLLDDIEVVEVIKGPQGNVSGTNASGGIIALQTRKGKGPFHMELGSDFGNYGTFKERFAFMGGNDKADYYFSTTWYKTDGGMRTSSLGEIDNDDYNNLSLVSNLGAKLLKDKGELRNIFKFSRARKNLGIGTEQTYPYDYYQAPNNYALNYDIFENLTFTHAPNEKYDYDVKFGLYHNENNNYINPDDLSGDDLYESISKISSTRLNFITQHNFKPVKWDTFSIGYNLEHESIDGRSFDNDSWNGENYNDYNGHTLQNDIYLNDVINIKDRLFIRGGARLSHNSDFGFYISPNASAALILPTFKIKGAETKFRGSWGQSNNNPTLYQRFGTVNSSYMKSLANPDLEAEKMNSWDVGFTQSFFDNKLSFDFGYFNSRYTNYIGYEGETDPTTYIYTGKYVNVDKARIQGYEGKITFEPNDKFKLLLNYTYTDSEDETTGLDLPATPRNRFNGTIIYTPFERWTMYFGLEAGSGRTMSVSSAESTSGYVDAKIGTSIRLFTYKGASLFLRANIYNLFNQNISMYRQGDEIYYSPKLRFNCGLFMEYNLPQKNKKEKV